MRNGSAIEVAYNSASHIRTCLQGILRNPGWQVLIVDNASSDTTAQVVADFSAAIKVVHNQQNRGFAAAANQGHDLASSEILLLLNPDAVAEEGALERFATAFADPAVGAAGGALLDGDGDTQRGFQYRRFPTLGAMLCEVLLVNRLWPGNPWNRRYRCLDLDDSKFQFVDQPAGACLAVRRQAWESIGGFDENFYPVWFEDVDFCRRLADHGWKIAYRPDARFRHIGGHSVSKLRFRDRQVFWYRNMVRYFSKHHGRVKTIALRAGILMGLVLRAGLCLLGLGPREVNLKQSLAGYACAAREVLQGDPAANPKQGSVGVTAV